MVMLISLTFSFYMRIKHMEAIFITYRDFLPLLLYICFGESPKILVLLCTFITMLGGLDLHSDHEFSISKHLCDIYALGRCFYQTVHSNCKHSTLKKHPHLQNESI